LNASGAMDLVGTTLNTSFTRLVTFGRRHHSPPYSILCDSLWGLHPNDNFSWDSQNWDLCCPKALDVHIFLKSSLFGACEGTILYPQNDLSKVVLHAPIKNHWTLALRGFVIGSENFNLIPALSFDHNSCILGLNEHCKNILGIYTSRPFQWYHGAQFGACLFF
jgi:hypothetical protein